jgi:glycosidase
MPLVYSGQESGMTKRLLFFEKDPVDWGDYNKTEFYQTILNLKDQHKALANGEEGGTWRRISSSDDENAFVILREKGNQQVLGIFNLSAREITIGMDDEKLGNEFNVLFDKEEITIDKNTRVKLPAWSYKILYR